MIEVTEVNLLMQKYTGNQDKLRRKDGLDFQFDLRLNPIFIEVILYRFPKR